MKKQRQGGSALDKAVQVLGALAEGGEPIGLADLTSQLGLPRQTVHRVVRQLESAGLIRRDFGRDQFTVGPRLLNLSLGTLATATHIAPMRAVLRNLVAHVGESCNVGVLDRDEVVYIERVECDWPLRLQLGPGSRVPVHATAIGKLLLAHMPSRMRKRILSAAPLEKLTERTVTDTSVLERELAQIRRRGYAVNVGENTLGLVGLAVPIADPARKVIAGLAVHGPEARMTVAQAEAQLPSLITAAAKLTGLFVGMAEMTARSAAE